MLDIYEDVQHLRGQLTMVIYEKNKIRKEVKVHFRQIFTDQNYEKNRLMIEEIARDYAYNIPIKELITEESLISQINKFSTNTTYGPDLIPPEIFKDKTIQNEIILFIQNMLNKNRVMIPED